MKIEAIEKYGAPSISIGGLNIWIHSREFQVNDYWDGNSLNATALCSTPTAKVWCTGAFLHLDGLSRWYKEILQLNDLLKGTASLNCWEPGLLVDMEINKTGHIATRVQITGDQMTESHEFKFSFDQTLLPELIESLKAVFKTYPLKKNKE